MFRNTKDSKSNSFTYTVFYSITIWTNFAKQTQHWMVHSWMQSVFVPWFLTPTLLYTTPVRGSKMGVQIWASWRIHSDRTTLVQRGEWPKVAVKKNRNIHGCDHSLEIHASFWNKNNQEYFPLFVSMPTFHPMCKTRKSLKFTSE